MSLKIKLIINEGNNTINYTVLNKKIPLFNEILKKIHVDLNDEVEFYYYKNKTYDKIKNIIYINYEKIKENKI